MDKKKYARKANNSIFKIKDGGGLLWSRLSEYLFVNVIALRSATQRKFVTDMLPGLTCSEICWNRSHYQEDR